MYIKVVQLHAVKYNGLGCCIRYTYRMKTLDSYLLHSENSWNRIVVCAHKYGRRDTPFSLRTLQLLTYSRNVHSVLHSSCQHWWINVRAQRRWIMSNYFPTWDRDINDVQYFLFFRWHSKLPKMCEGSYMKIYNWNEWRLLLLVHIEKSLFSRVIISTVYRTITRWDRKCV